MQVAAGRSRPQRRSGSVPFLQGLKEPDRLVEAEAMTIEDYRGLVERRAARVEPDDVGGLGGKCGIIALAPVRRLDPGCARNDPPANDCSTETFRPSTTGRADRAMRAGGGAPVAVSMESKFFLSS
jgi:hypothetical protein